MDLKSYLRILRRRWLLLLVPMIGSLVIAIATLPDQTDQTAPVATQYTATATLITSASADQAAPLNLSTVALFAGLGDIPIRRPRRSTTPASPRSSRQA